MKKFLSMTIGAMALLFIGACAEAEVLLPIKPVAYAQSDYCAEACIQEALRFLGKEISQRDINKAGGGNGAEGLWSDGVEAALKKLKVEHESWRLKSVDYDEYVAMLKEKLDEGYSVLVGVKIKPDKYPNWFCDHFILLVGYTDDSFIYNSPTEREQRTFDKFRKGASGLTLTNKFNYYFGVAFKGMKP